MCDPGNSLQPPQRCHCTDRHLSVGSGLTVTPGVRDHPTTSSVTSKPRLCREAPPCMSYLTMSLFQDDGKQEDPFF